jgi:hypothetical protein
MTPDKWTVVDTPLSSRNPGKRALRVTSVDAIQEAVRLACADPEIDGVWADLPGRLLADLPADIFPEKLRFTLYLGGTGGVLAYSDKLAALKKPGVSVFLPATRQGLAELRVLSSLGVRCGIILGPEAPDWESLTDLLYYAAYSKVPHAGIQPFAYVHSNYKGPASQLDLRAAYFRPAVSGVMAAEEAFSGGLNTCSSCPGWRVCGGALSAYVSPESAPCRAFAADLLETAEHCHAKNNI